MIPGFIPIQRSQTQFQQSQQTVINPEDPAEFLFTANQGFGLPTSNRSKRKNGKVLLVTVAFMLREIFVIYRLQEKQILMEDLSILTSLRLLAQQISGELMQNFYQRLFQCAHTC